MKAKYMYKKNLSITGRALSSSGPWLRRTIEATLLQRQVCYVKLRQTAIKQRFLTLLLLKPKANIKGPVN
jgi:hypothetical protein